MRKPRRQSATRFFYQHAGYNWDPKTETKSQGRWKCARQLATAEGYAADASWCFSWVPDDTPWDGDAPAPKELFGCVLRTDADGGHVVLASLWGIGDPDPDYSRVVEAELALEAIGAIEESLTYV